MRKYDQTRVESRKVHANGGRAMAHVKKSWRPRKALTCTNILYIIDLVGYFYRYVRYTTTGALAIGWSRLSGLSLVIMPVPVFVCSWPWFVQRVECVGQPMKVVLRACVCERALSCTCVCRLQLAF